MVGRHVREQASEQRREPAREEFEHAGALADFHHPQPQRHHAGQAEGDFKCGPAAVEQRLDQRGKDRGVAEHDQLE